MFETGLTIYPATAHAVADPGVEYRQILQMLQLLSNLHPVQSVADLDGNENETVSQMVSQTFFTGERLGVRPHDGFDETVQESLRDSLQIRHIGSAIGPCIDYCSRVSSPTNVLTAAARQAGSGHRKFSRAKSIHEDP